MLIESAKLSQSYIYVTQYTRNPKYLSELLEFIDSIYGKNAKNKCVHNNNVFNDISCPECVKYCFNYIIPINDKFKILSHCLYEVDSNPCFCMGPHMKYYNDNTKTHLVNRASIISRLENFVNTYDRLNKRDMDELIDSARLYLKECKNITTYTKIKT